MSSGKVGTYVFRSPTNEKVVIENLAQFCRENDLCQPHMSAVWLRKRKTHKKWSRWL